MQKQVEKSSEYLKKLLNKAVLPRNQLSTISGISNTYIRDLENGNIAKVSRTKIIALAVALNLGLTEIENLFSVFGLPPLSAADVDLIIEKFNYRKFTKAIIPIRDFFAYELMTHSIEQIPGEKVIVNDRPAISLRPRGHRSYTDENLVKAHPMYGDLVEAIGKKREQTFANNLFNFKERHYICKNCLEDYLLVCPDLKEQKFRAQHIKNMLNYIRTFSNLRVYLTSICSGHLFTIKYPLATESDEPSLSFCARPGHFVKHDRAGRLSGFATKNPVMICNFQEELKSIKESVIEEFLDDKRFEEYLVELVAPYLD